MLVTRTAKDGQLRMVFWNEIKPVEEGAGKLVEKGDIAVLLRRSCSSLSQNSLTFGTNFQSRMMLICCGSWHRVRAAAIHTFSDIHSVFRGSSGHICRGRCSQESRSEEKGQEGIRTSSTTGQDHQHPSQDRARPSARVCRSVGSKVDIRCRVYYSLS